MAGSGDPAGSGLIGVSGQVRGVWGQRRLFRIRTVGSFLILSVVPLGPPGSGSYGIVKVW